MKQRTTRLAPTSCLRQQGFRGAWQRLSMTLLATLLLTLTAQMAWAQSPLPAPDGEGNVTITTPGTYDASGHIYGNLIINTSGEVILNVGNLTVQGNLQLNGGTLALYVHDGSHINAQDIPVVNTLYMDGGEITCISIGFQSGTVSDGTINALAIGAAGTISGGTLTATDRFFAGASNYPTDYYLTITGGAISAPTFEILKATTINAANASLSITADTYDDYSGFALTLDGTRSLIDAGDFNNIYDPGVLSVSAIAGKTLRPAYTVTFDENGGSDVSDLTVAGGSTISDPGSTKTGYTATWKKGEDVYNFTAKVENDLTLTAQWSANTYTVHFDSNGGSGTMADMNLTYDGDWATLTAVGFTAPDTYFFGRWNTKADGSGASYDNKEWVKNLTTDNGATVTLYAQWAKDIDKWCTAEVPNQAKSAYSTVDQRDREYDYIYNKFDEANWPASYGISVGETVKEGGKTLTLGTDYKFGDVYYSDMTGMNQPENVGDKCLVEIIGMGDYAGTLYAPFRIIVPDADGTWGKLKWVYSDGTLTISKKDGEEGNVAMPDGNNYDDFDWKGVASGVFTLTIGEGITNVGNYAFGSNNGVQHYGNLTTINLPSTLTTIGNYAFAYCGGLTIDLSDIPTSVTTIGSNAFGYVDGLTATLTALESGSSVERLSSVFAGYNVEVDFSRSFTSGVASTICLPFAYTKQEGDGSFYAFTSIEKVGDDYVATMTEPGETTLSANTPYLFSPAKSSVTFTGTIASVPAEITAGTTSSTDTYWTFQGTYSRLEYGTTPFNDPVFGFAANDGLNGVTAGEFVRADDGAFIPAFRAFLKYSGSDETFKARAKGAGIEALPEYITVRLIGKNGDVDAIGEISLSTGEVTFDSNAWYDLSGRKLNGVPTQKGIYINKGKKVALH